MQDSILGPKYIVFWVCPAAENLPILPPFLFPEGAVLTHAGRGYPLLTPPDSLSRECENGFHFRIDDTRLYWRLTAHAGLDDCSGISPQNPFLICRFDSE